MKHEHLLILAVVLQLAIGIYGFSLAEDTPIHTEMLNLIIDDPLYPETYEPLTNVLFTYPPFLHYSAYGLTFFGLDPFLSIKLVGLISFILFPITMYLLGSLFNKRTAVVSALASTTVINVLIVYVLGEFPEMLAIDFLVLFVYFFFKKKNWLAGLFLGLTVLTHPFMGPLAVIFSFVLLLMYQNKEVLKAQGTGFLISLLWLPRYFLIAKHAGQGSWHNMVNYSYLPGWLSLGNAFEYLVRLNPILFIFSLFGFGILFLMVFKKSKNPREAIFFIFLYLICLFLTVYHYAPAQLKFLDLFSVPVILFASFGIAKVLEISKKFYWPVVFCFLIFLIFPFLQMNHYYGLPGVSFDSSLKEAASFLKQFDKEKATIVVDFEERWWGKTELIFSQLADKRPMDAYISDLEAYTPEYKQQLIERKKIIEGDYSSLEKNQIKYLISRKDSNLPKIYDEKGIKIYLIKFLKK